MTAVALQALQPTCLIPKHIPANAPLAHGEGSVVSGLLELSGPGPCSPSGLSGHLQHPPNSARGRRANVLHHPQSIQMTSSAWASG